MKTTDDIQMDCGWNDRFYEFKEEKVSQVLWKNVETDKWVYFHDRISRDLKRLSKLDVALQVAILSKIVYKHQNQMRRDKPFQYFKKVNGLARRYNEMDIVPMFLFYQDILKILKTSSASVVNQVEIPRKEFTCYIMDRLLGASKLAVHIQVVCQKAFIYLDSHMRHGFFVPFNLFGLASVSRIWMLLKDVIQVLKMLYLVMKEILQYQLESRQESYPVSLDEWLKEDIGEVLPQIDGKREEKVMNGVLSRMIPDTLQNSPISDNFNETPVSIFAADDKLEDLGESVSLDYYQKHRNGKLDVGFRSEKSDNVCNEKSSTNEQSHYSKDVIDVEETSCLNTGPFKSRETLKCPVCSDLLRSMTPSLNLPFRRKVHLRKRDRIQPQGNTNLFNLTRAVKRKELLKKFKVLRKINKSRLRLKQNKLHTSRTAYLKHLLLHSPDVNETRRILLLRRTRNTRQQK